MATPGRDKHKITDHFPPSPKVEESAHTKDGLLKTPTKQEAVIDLTSVLLTPEKTPTKDLKKLPDNDASGDSHIATKQVVTKSSEVTSSTKQPARRKPRKGKKDVDKGASQQTDSRKKKTESTSRNSLLTDFFPVRRSERRTKTDIKKEEQKELEEAILSGKTAGLEVVDIEGKGRGVKATKVFQRGDFVVEYNGDLISLKAAKKREEKYSLEPDKYGCYMYYFHFNNKSYCVDATAESGKIGRLVNHSNKKNNLTTRVVGIDERPYLILVAARDIEVGEELLYDYGDRSKASIESHPWLVL